MLVIDKPAGPTSHDIVAIVRRALGVTRVGHTGTLDPLATGVLPLVVGRATRLATFISGADKEYVARVRFGASTASYDAECVDAGTVSGALPDVGEVLAALTRFTGTYLQQPPPFSAKKIAGTPAYKLARRKAPVAIKPVEVTVHELELRGCADGAADVRIVCSSGFYVRSFAHDLGAAIGCGAYLEGLRRTRVGAFTLEDAIPLSAAVDDGEHARSSIVPLERLLPELAAADLTERGVRRASHGNTLTLAGGDFRLTDTVAGARSGARFRLIDPSGRLIGIAELGVGGLLHPCVVLV